MFGIGKITFDAHTVKNKSGVYCSNELEMIEDNAAIVSCYKNVLILIVLIALLTCKHLKKAIVVCLQGIQLRACIRRTSGSD